jgi:intein/homing endonuclease
MLKGFGRYTSYANMDGSRRFASRANSFSAMPPMAGYGGGGSGGSRVSGYSATMAMAPMPMLEGIIDTNNRQVLHRIYRDIHANQPTAGMAVDLMSSLAFGDNFSLTGIKERKVLESYIRSIENIHTKTILPFLAAEYLVIGTFIASLNWDSSKRLFNSISPQHIDLCQLDMVPIFGVAPLVTVNFPPELIRTLSSPDPRMQKLLSNLPETMRLGLQNKKVPLDPKSTIYIMRGSFPTEPYGVSYYRRILSLYILEKALMRGTIDQAYRRQRAITIATVGDDNWEPSEEEISDVSNLIAQADADPVSAIIAFRNGVALSDFKRGDDFWKISDASDYINSSILQALGISQGLITGDANIACVTGDTLIPTDKGVIRIDKICSREWGDEQVINHRVTGRYDNERSVKWYYKGFQPVRRIVTEIGNALKCTDIHRLLTLENGTTDWQLSSNISIGDWLCISTQAIEREGRLKLNLSDSNEHTVGKGTASHKWWLTKPEYMTTDLAEILSYLTSEGSVQNNNRNYRTSFYNSDLKVLARIKLLMKKIFNADPINDDVLLRFKAGDSRNIYPSMDRYWATDYLENEVITATKDSYALSYIGKSLVTWFTELGAYCVEGRINGKIASHRKEVPWSILQADRESQSAFLAAYLEGDGSVSEQLIFCSRSSILLHQLQILLNSFGLISTLQGKKHPNLVLSSNESLVLWPKIKPYMVSKCLKILPWYKGRKLFGIPTDWWKELLQKRQLPKLNKKAGVSFINDDGIIVKLSERWVNWASVDIRFTYDCYDNGKYDKFLEQLKLISLAAYYKLIELFELRYRFVRVIENKSIGKEHVYDKSMQRGVEPAYVANGLITHNTADTALSMFVESVRTFRDRITRELFYDKIFPTIAVANDFKKPRNMETGSVRNDGVIWEHYGTQIIQSGDNLTALCADNVHNLISEVDDITRYWMPMVHWHRSLRPEMDSAVLSYLQELIALGFPLPMAAIAAAGGISLEETMRGLDEDLRIRRKIAEYEKELASFAPQPPGGANARVIEQAAKLLAGRGSVIPPARNFENSDFGPFTRNNHGTWQKLSPKGQRIANDSMAKMLATTLTRLNKRQNIIIRKEHEQLAAE